jgi:type VI secretion system secreted protein Hcp
MRSAPFIQHAFAAAAASLALASPVTASAADWFLKLDGIEGESTDARHKNEIEVLSWSWGVSQSSPTTATGRASAAKTCLSDIAFTKLIDKSTPLLLADAASGTFIKNATLVGRKAGKEQQEYIKIVLKDVIITSFSTGASGGATPTEQVTLGFGAMDMEYKVQKDDGSLGEAVKANVSGGC